MAEDRDVPSKESGRRRVLDSLWAKVRALRPKPRNTIQANLRTWTRWDWARAGEEWSSTEEWKRGLVRHVLEPHVTPGSRVLEIGPGAGRWTEYLVQRASHVTAVDLTPRCIEMCRRRFKDARNIEFHVNDGRDLGFVPDASIDRIWSFDVFVHILAEDVDNYVRQFPRLLRPGGEGLIHHSKNGVYAAAWRSDMTAAKMREICARHGFEVLFQFDSWDEGRVPIYGVGPGQDSPDVVTVFRKPA